MNLAAINTAIELGDPVVPPKGTVYEYIDKQYMRRWRVLLDIGNSDDSSLFVVRHSGYNKITVAYLLFPDIPYQRIKILHVETGIPPFEVWKRAYTPGKSIVMQDRGFFIAGRHYEIFKISNSCAIREEGLLLKPKEYGHFSHPVY